MTRDPERIDRILDELAHYWKKYPDLRLGQIVSNATYANMGEKDPFYLEDEQFLRFLEETNQEPSHGTDHEDVEDSPLMEILDLYKEKMNDVIDVLEEMDSEKEDESSRFEEWRKNIGDWRDDLSCPECGNDDYVVDGWCIKCTECGERSRSHWDWK